MVVTKVSIDSDKKWCLIIEGQEKGKKVFTYIAIPPTDGNRVDVITDIDLETGYHYDQSVIVIMIINGTPSVTFFN